MRKPIRFKLSLVPVGVCLLLMMSFGGTAFASRAGTHPQLSGPKYVTSSYGGAVVKVHGSNFLPSSTAQVFVIASAGSQVQGPPAGFSTPVDAHGSFTAFFPISGLGNPNLWFQIVSQDLTTGFYTNIILTMSDGKTGPRPLPRLSGPEEVNSSGGCANVKVHGSNFLPSSTAQVSVFASTGSGIYTTISPTIDAHGSFTAILQICGPSLTHDLIEIASEDFGTYLYANMIYTITDN